jgi:inorganic triphosphatase YgiF
LETELKFVIDAEGAARLRAALGLPAQGRRLRSVYFDTPSLDLKSAGFVLRVREDGAQRIQAVKQANGSLFTRHEWETTLGAEPLDFSAIDATPLGARLGRRRRENLAPAFEVDVWRAKREIEFEGARIEAALDEGEVRTVGQRTAIRELELELVSGDPAALFALARSLSAANPTLSFLTKSARGFALARDEATAAAALAPPALTGDQTSAAGFRAVASAALAHIAAHGEILRAAYDDEAVRQLRVGTRRLRSAIALFKPLFDEAALAPVLDPIRWLARACDGARDLDVFLSEHFAPLAAEAGGPPSLVPLGVALARRRTKAHRRARDAVASARFRALLLETAAWIEAGDWTHDTDRAGARATDLETYGREALDRAFSRVNRRAAALKAEEAAPRHRLRVADKTLRFAAAVFAPVFDQAGAGEIKTFRRTAAKAQDRLGALTDVISAHALCDDVARTEGAADPAIAFAAGYVAGRMAAGEPQRLKAARKAVRELNEAKPFW